MKRKILCGLLALGVFAGQAYCDTKGLEQGKDSKFVHIAQGYSFGILLSTPYSNVVPKDESVPVLIKIENKEPFVPFVGELTLSKNFNTAQCVVMGEATNAEKGYSTIRLRKIGCTIQDGNKDLYFEGNIKGWVFDSKTKSIDINAPKEGASVVVWFAGGDNIEFSDKYPSKPIRKVLSKD